MNTCLGVWPRVRFSMRLCRGNCTSLQVYSQQGWWAGSPWWHHGRLLGIKGRLRLLGMWTVLGTGEPCSWQGSPKGYGYLVVVTGAEVDFESHLWCMVSPNWKFISIAHVAFT